MWITDALSLSHVYRWSVVRMSHPQSVAEHSFNVAMIVQEIINRHPALIKVPVEGFPTIRMCNTIWHALTHDIDECVTGDIPGIAKQHLRSKREMPELVPDLPQVGVTLPEIKIVKVADRIEAYTYCRQFGHGPHAYAVSGWLQTVMQKELDEAYNDGLLYKDRIAEMLQSIMAEKGRLRTYGDYDPVRGGSL